ncbi:hypothetical protein [Antrihabitans cavernicola]|uniref:Large secreted protein n=1 Tax=Antrihabitans cavernicola TaxID=2495913 RepID=A0A5A7SED7_9NOCA|nr:hypothetical protein [Spelaeibacter cavernicola]KAA0023769.1 hypothetical protein FOY51_03955 [Spelaeibacter cavernicola]
MRRIATALLTPGLLLVALAGCATAGTALPAPGSSSPSPDRPASDGGIAFTPNPTIVNPHPLAFQSWNPAGEHGERVALHFTIGSPSCYGVDGNVVSETDTTVTVDLRSGSLPEAAGKMCSMIAVFGTVELPLQASLGTRNVITDR